MNCIVTTVCYAQINIQPFWHGKVMENFEIPLNKMKKPKQIIKGKFDECNGVYFPDKWVYEDGIILSTGILETVYVNANNGLKYGNRRLNHTLTEQQLKNMFNHKISMLEEHVYYLQPWEGDNSSLSFYFRNGKLDHYTLSIDDC